MNVIPYTPQVSSGRSVDKVNAAENAIAAKKAAADKVAELAEVAEPSWKKKTATKSSHRVSNASTNPSPSASRGLTTKSVASAHA